ncbi:MAG: crotonyl-CoA carboxylase/reductase [Myxococcaceae bacterium]
MARNCYEIGERPPLGEVPKRMLAQVVRPGRFGEPAQAMRVEEVEVPALCPFDVLVCVMAGGINYNGVWAARGTPVDVCKLHARYGEPDDFHIAGSDASGIVYAVGEKVESVRVGAHVVVHCGQWDVTAPEIVEGLDPTFHSSFRIWGYESNWGAFAQFARVQAHQCMPKARHLTWEQAAAPTLVGATAYRMLHGWAPNRVRAKDPVLVWGGAGGLGSMAIQLARLAEARPVAVISSEDKKAYCERLGAVGVIDRGRFDHWTVAPHWTQELAFAAWLKGVRAFGQAFWGALGEKRCPAIVVEHPGETTIATSMFLCDTGGMTVICAGTSGYSPVVDLRYLWMRQKRLQGSHFANDEQANAFNELVRGERINVCLSRTFPFEEIGQAHQLMGENRHTPGNMAALVGASREGLFE